MILLIVLIIISGCKKEDSYNENLLHELEQLNKTIDSVYKHSFMDSLNDDMDSMRMKSDSTMNELQKNIEKNN